MYCIYIGGLMGYMCISHKVAICSLWTVCPFLFRDAEDLGSEKDQLETDNRMSKETIEKLTQEIERMESKLQRKRTESKENLLYDAFYVEDLESKIEAHRAREANLETELANLNRKLAKDRLSRSSPASYQLSKSGSFAVKNLPQDPQEQASYFYRMLLRAESYRKALVWQKRYLSLLLSSYQESEMLALGRLAKMSGARRTLVADTATCNQTKPSLKVVVIAMTAVTRMKFLVKRWRKSRRSPKRAYSSEQEVERAPRLKLRQDTATKTPELDFTRK